MRELRRERAKLEGEIRRIERELGVGKARAVRKKGAKAAGAAPKRKRASQAEIGLLKGRVQKAVAAAGKKGIGMGDLRKKVRAKVAQLRLILKKLAAEKKVKKSGQRRFTRYHAA